MLRTILDARGLVAMLIAATVGAWGLHVYPVQSDDVFLALIELRKPALFQVLAYGYATLWFTTPFFLASLLTSVLAIAVYRHAPTARCRDLPPYPEPETREHPSLVLGETHRLTTPGRAAEPTWLTIPQRGLYTGIMILGAVGTGKTSACMYPYVDQLLRWRAHDADGKVGGSSWRSKATSAVRCGGSWPARVASRITSKSGSTAASATTPYTTISIRMRWPLRSPRCSTTCLASRKNPF